MNKRYIKNPAAGHVSLPVVGLVTEGQILVGNFDQYVPQFLLEVPNVPRGVPLESRPSQSGPRQLNEVMRAAPTQSGPQRVEEQAPTAAPVKRPRGRPRKHPLPTQ